MSIECANKISGVKTECGRFSDCSTKSHSSPNRPNYSYFAESPKNEKVNSTTSRRQGRTDRVERGMLSKLKPGVVILKKQGLVKLCLMAGLARKYGVDSKSSGIGNQIRQQVDTGAAIDVQHHCSGNNWYPAKSLSALKNKALAISYHKTQIICKSRTPRSWEIPTSSSSSVALASLALRLIASPTAFPGGPSWLLHSKFHGVSQQNCLFDWFRVMQAYASSKIWVQTPNKLIQH